MCAALNAFPALGDELCATNDCSKVDTRELKSAVAALAGQNSEAFGDRDNRQEVAVLARWADQTAAGSEQSTVFQQLAARMPMATRLLMAGLDIGSIHTASDYCAALKEGWLMSDTRTLCAPSVVLSSGRRIPVHALCRDGMVDFGSCIDAQGARMKQAKIEAAQARVRTMGSVVGGIRRENDTAGCREIADSLHMLRRWIESPAMGVLAESGVDTRHDAVTSALAKMDAWQGILDTVGAQEQSARETLDALQRPALYVLRAFLLEDTMAQADSPTRFSVVRRYGKAAGSSNYSVLNADGMCVPVRASDLRGVVVECMWVCCGVDAECGADLENGGINVVVADPDDEICCKVCAGHESLGYDKIVICDSCDYAFHQLCHAPVVMERELAHDTWYCSDCAQAIKMSRGAKRLRLE
ncbi:mitochondrial transcription factor 2 [Linderina pennispora]|nr:mitochondrial transcription factor 2 [Linderina pennispora]